MSITDDREFLRLYRDTLDCLDAANNVGSTGTLDEESAYYAYKECNYLHTVAFNKMVEYIDKLIEEKIK